MPTEREVFQRLFVNRGPMRPTDFAREIMTLGLVAYYKWDQVLSRKTDTSTHTIPPEAPEQFQLTDQRVHDIESLVMDALREHAERGRTMRGFWYGVSQSVVGAFVYSLLVAAVVLALVFGNVSVPALVGIEFRPTSIEPAEGRGK